MKKKALILYSGGKDSHLALLTAVKRGYDPILWYLDGGDRRHILFSNYIGYDIVKAHAKMAGLNLFSIKTNDLQKNDVRTLLKKITEIIRLSNKEGKIEYFSSLDYQQDEKDKKINEYIKYICKNSGVKFISFLDIIKKDDIFPPIKMSIRSGVKSIIIGLEKEIDKSWLLKPIDESFMEMIKREIKSGKNIDGNSYQSLVIESPLFGNKKMKILDTGYAYDSKDRRHFSIINKFSIVRQRAKKS